ncbi:phage tail tape measure protein [Novosphingobium aquae]|uniref:phage tail tape measure protein n=1 Tax=Novosphingobium aquae TaxID=3133435 RepID=UPI003A94891A
MESNVKVKIDAIDNTKGAFASLSLNLEKVGEATSSMRSKMEDLQPTFQKMAAVGTAAFAGIAAASIKSIHAYAEVERAQRQLNNAVINVSKGTKEQISEINTLTAALEKKAGVDADALTMGVAQLSTFGLSTSAVINLTKSLADLTVNQNGVNATSEEYISNANTIAKALNGQFGVLERSGIRFTEAQQNLILYGNETERVAALQEGLNQNLRETTDTVSGIDLNEAQLLRSIESITEALGQSLAPAFADIAQKVLPIIQSFADWAAKNPELTEKIVLVAAAIAALIAIMGALGLVFLAFNPIAAGIVLAFVGVSAIVYAVKNAMEQFGASWSNVWTVVKDATLIAIDAMLGPLDEIVSAVARAIEALASLPGVKSAVSITKNAFSSITDLFRADGGPVSSGRGYIVGERGPEWFEPGQSGTIIPNHALAGAGAGGGTNITLYISGTFLDDRQAAKRLGTEIMGMLKQNTRL